MAKRITFCIKYWLLWILIFQAGRSIFFMLNLGEAKKAGLVNCLYSAMHGLRMDASMAAYFTIPVILLLLIIVVFGRLPLQGVLKAYSIVILSLSIFLSFADGNAFRAWGFRLDASVLRYLKNPKEAWASVSHLPVFWLFLGFVIITWLAFKPFIALINRAVFSTSQRWQNAVLLILLLGLSIIPLRGGLQLAPLNQSTVYFSQNNFLNQAAVNAHWNFVFSLLRQKENEGNPFVYLSNAEAENRIKTLYPRENIQWSFIDTTANKRPNVIFIVWESFTAKAVGLTRNGVPIVPGFERMTREGIFFDSVYATGDRTDKGIVAVLSGFPAQPTTSIVKNPQKAAKLPMLSKAFSKNGYSTAFYYGGELEFANMKAYLLSGQFTDYISISDFEKSDQNSKWGAHDGIVANRLFTDLQKKQEPFFCTWLTLSSHEPFETPVAPVIKGADEESMFLNALHYSDSVVSNFLFNCSKQPWWQNTIVVITGDHGHRLPDLGNKADYFRTPVLFTGGALRYRDTVVHNVASQIDIGVTLLNQLRLPSSEFGQRPWGKNMVNAQNQWAYSAYNNGFAVFSSGRYFFFDNVGRQVSEQQGITDSAFIKLGFSLQQKIFDDYLSK